MGPLDSLAVTTFPWRDGAGRTRVTAVVKVTFALRAGALAEVTEPEALAAERDLAPLKMHADVTVTGRPHLHPAGALVSAVGLAVARGADVRVQRRLVAIARGPGSSPPATGADRGLADARLVDPETFAAASLEALPPSHERRRRHLASAHAALLGASPLALPADFDVRFFQHAPPEQQCAALLGGERILLVGLVPGAVPAAIFRLPALHAFAQIDGPGARRRAPPLAGDTLHIDAERRLASVTFRGSVEIAPAFARAACEPGAFTIRAGLAPCDDVEATLAPPRAWSSFEPPRRPARPPSPTVDPVTLANESGLAAGTLAWSADPKTTRRAVIVKATFDVPPGGGPLTLADAQEDLHGDVYTGDGDELDRASDFVPFKAQTDVLLRGTAHAPSGATTALVALSVGPLRARVAALPPRAWGKDGVPRPTGPFAPVPLRWRHAFGGPALAANPAGTGLVEGSAPPLLEDPDQLMRTRADRPKPAGLGPIAPSWDARRALTGTFDAAWQRDRWPLFPADFDPAYFQAAPPAQRCVHMTGDEPFRAEHVVPGGGAIEGVLPGLRPRAFLERDPLPPPAAAAPPHAPVSTAPEPAAFSEIPLRLDTFVLDADASRVTLTWRGLCDLAGRTARITVVRDDLAAPRPLESIAALLCARRVEGLADPSAPPAPSARSYALADALRLRPRRPPRGSASAASLALAVAAGAGPFAGATAAPEAPAAPPPPSRAAVEALLADGHDIRDLDLSGATLAGIDLSGRDLRGALLTGADLSGARLAGANLTGAKLAAVRAPDSTWDGADLSKADLTGATLPRASFARARLDHAKLADATLDDAVLDAAEGEGTSFAGASLARLRAPSAKLPKADFTAARLPAATFAKASLPDARFLDCEAPAAAFDEANLADARFENALLAKATFASASAPGAVFEAADLTVAHLRKADLTGAIFTAAVLSGADLRGVLAPGAVFRSARMDAARLDGADLTRATFEGADLRRALLTGANLYQAETWQSHLDGADLTGALLAGTKLAARSTP